jgi:HSP20 family protein
LDAGDASGIADAHQPDRIGRPEEETEEAGDLHGRAVPRNGHGRCSKAITPWRKEEGAMTPLTRWEPVARWNPWKELEEMEKRLSTIFGRPPAGTAGDKQEAITVAEWSPLVDITEDDKEYVIKAELPEMKKEDIKINVHDDVLTISGERKYEKEEKGKKYHRVERAYGSFLRSFTLP